jgi:hypothetical protein
LVFGVESAAEHIFHQHVIFPECVGESRRVSDHDVRRAGRSLPPHEAFLEVDDDQRRS